MDDTSNNTVFERIKPWTDCHVHLFPDDLYRSIGDWFERETDWELPYMGRSAHEIIDMLREWGVEEIFSLAYCHRPNMSIQLNKWLETIIKSDSELPIHAFGAVHPNDNNLSEVIEYPLDELNFAGFKLQCSVMGVLRMTPRWRPSPMLWSHEERI